MATLQSNTAQAQKAAAEVRRRQAFNLRVAGASYRAIATNLGCNEATAFRDVQVVLQRIRKATDETGEEYLTLEVERIERAMVALADNVQKGHLGAIDRWLSLCESRRRLLGLDAPRRAELTGKEGAPLFPEEDELDYSQLSTPELKALEDLLEKCQPRKGAGGARKA